MYFNLSHSLHTSMHLEPILGKFFRNITRTLGLRNPSNMSLLLCIIRCRLGFTTFLKFRHRRFIFPSILIIRISSQQLVGNGEYLTWDSSYSAVFPAGFQPQHPQCLWHHHPFLFIVRWWNTLKHFQSFQSRFPTFCFTWNHPTNSFIKNPWWSTEMEWSLHPY